MFPTMNTVNNKEKFHGEHTHSTVTTRNSRLESDFLERDRFPGDFVLGFVHNSVSPLSYLFHFLKRIHVFFG